MEQKNGNLMQINTVFCFINIFFRAILLCFNNYLYICSDYYARWKSCKYSLKSKIPYK